MKEISIRELHARTGHWLREAVRSGAIQVTDNGKRVAKIVPADVEHEVPFFARRKKSRAFEKLERSGRLGAGRDSTLGISEDREDRPA